MMTLSPPPPTSAFVTNRRTLSSKQAEPSDSGEITTRVHQTTSKIYKDLSQNLTFINKQYKALFLPEALLLETLPSKLLSGTFLPADVIKIVAEYVSSEFTDSPYLIAPDLIDPKLSLELNLDPHYLTREIDVNDQLEEEARLETVNASKSNPTDRVSVIRFTRDSKPNRWFVIREPKDSPGICYNASKVLENYENTFCISNRLNEHPLFVKVAGIVVKEIEGKIAPYLIFEYIKGTPLVDLLEKKELLLVDKIKIITQFFEAIIVFFEKGIYPESIYANHLVITKEMQLKFTNGDNWFFTDPCSFELADKLYECAAICVGWFLSHPSEIIGSPFAELNPEDIANSFKSSLEILLHWFQNKNS